MTKRRKTGFDKFFGEQMRRLSFAARYRDARSRIDAVDRFVRALDEARTHLGMSKAELARRISAKPEIVRRLFTGADPNPTLSTVLKLVAALGLGLEIVPASAALRITRSERNRRRAAA